MAVVRPGLTLFQHGGRRQRAFGPVAQAAQKATGGRSLGTGAGKVIALEGAAPPKAVPITEWDSLEQAQPFYKSKAWTDLAPQREKAITRYRDLCIVALEARI